MSGPTLKYRGPLSALSPDDTQKFILAEMAKWGKVVKDNGIKVQ